MYIGEILKTDSANGTGIRLSLFVSGCTNHCKGCFQPQTWDFKYGIKYDDKIEDDIIRELSKPYYTGITLLGGDPMEEVNQRGLLPLLRRIKKEIPNRDVWAYTGFLFDKDLVPGGKRYFEDVTDELLGMINVLIDGPFILSKKDLTLKFRGSSNQRVIDVQTSRNINEVVEIV